MKWPATPAAVPGPQRRSKPSPTTTSWSTGTPGNSAKFAGDVPYHDKDKMLPVHRTWPLPLPRHHIASPTGKFEWLRSTLARIDWVGQFKAFVRDGYHFAVGAKPTGPAAFPRPEPT